MFFVERGRVKKLASTTKQDGFDVKTACLDILRDIYSASRKLMLYPIDHPIANETLKKPLERLNDIFIFKRSFIIQTYNNRLVAEGLLLEENVFVNGLLMDLTKHNINSVELTSDVGIGDLFHLLSKLIEDKHPVKDYIEKYLTGKSITTIILNKKNSHTLYNFEDTEIGVRKPSFILSDRIKDILLNDPETVAAYYLSNIKSDEDVVERTGVDLRYYFLKDHFASIIAMMPEDKALDIFKKVIYSANWLDETVNESVLSGLQQLWQDFAGRSEDVAILLPIYDIFKSVGAPESILESIFNKGALLKLSAVRNAEEFVHHLKRSQAREIDFQLLRKTVFKLATDSYSRPLENLLGQLLKSLQAKDLDTRQRGLRLIIETLQTLTDGSFWDISSAFIKEILRLAHAPDPGPEVIELIKWVLENSAENGRWEEMKICGQTLKSLAGSSSNYCRKLAADHLQEFAESSIMNDILVEAVISGKGDTELYQSIAILASAKIAQTLIEKIDATDKAVRARVIKALTSMGRTIGPEITRALAKVVSDGEVNEDINWYKARNILRVIGQVKCAEALPYYEIIAGWKQPRIKLEIIRSCEIMAIPAVGSILSKLAIDDDPEIRKAAVVALGLSGNPDMLKYLRRLFDDARSDKVLLVAAIGRIDGSQARDILIDLYEDENIYTGLGISKKEEQNIKVAILKALSKIGDDVSRSKMALYSASGKNKLFKKDVLSQTAAILLGGNKK